MINKELGGQRIGSGSKMNVPLHGYGRSSHNLSRQWRSTMAPGTLVPFLVEPNLNGDTWEINLETLIRTHPTVGPVFGSFKVQLDIFNCPIRLYNRQLHNNKFGIGNKMQTVIFPQVRLVGPNINRYTNEGNEAHIAQDSVMAYLGQRGLGKTNQGEGGGYVRRNVNGMPLLMYWDIVKNYYANKQEEIGYGIGARVAEDVESRIDYIEVRNLQGTGSIITYQNIAVNEYASITVPEGGSMTVYGEGIQNGAFNCSVAGQIIKIEDIGWDETTQYDGAGKWAIYRGPASQVIINPTEEENGTKVFFKWNESTIGAVRSEIELVQYPLSNIDEMRELILSHPNTSPLIMGPDDEQGQINMLPYNLSYGGTTIGGIDYCGSYFKMGGLALKTYQSDRFNNWLLTDWIDGEGGISDMTKIDTSTGSFTMDALNIQKKLYNLMNRIVTSGNSYYDWQEAIWGEGVMRHAETPMYCGGMSTEIVFGEIVSSSDANAGGEYQPLGTLAGKGNEYKERQKGGRIRIKTEEPSIIIGIASITPRIDYSQGNKWFTRWVTMNDLHKPELDGIGFQELITDEMAAWDTNVGINDKPNYKSAGKQPSWIEYMTSQNECYGNFARPNAEMFMTLNRQYKISETNGNIEDLTTYVDPEKYDYIFAYKKLGAQNFWVQIGMDILARRKMSAKIIPNL